MTPKSKSQAQQAFSFDDEDQTPVEPVVRPWNEVPQPLFLSWSPAMQYSYCAARDEDSARSETSEEFKAFYLERAVSYREIR